MFGKKSLLFTMSLLAGSGLVLAQTAGIQRPPVITQVMPMGGKAGATIEVTITGANLEKAQGLHFNFPGAKVEVIGETTKAPPIDPKQKKGGMKGPAATTAQKFKITLPDNIPLGVHDVRIVTAVGVSNARAFVVGDLKEDLEKENNDDVPKGQQVEMNTTVNGVIGSNTDVDYFLFSGKKGQRVVASCLTSSIDSKLASQLQLYSAAGAFLGSNKGYYQNDSLLDAVLPADGDYYLRLSSFAYIQGGPEFFYRLSISTGPWIDAVFPAVVEPGKETKVTVYGRNLPGGTSAKMTAEGRPLEVMTTTVKAPTNQTQLHFSGHGATTLAGLDGFDFRLKNPTGTSNPYFLQFARHPVILDEGDNNIPEKGQKVVIPCDISGRIEKNADRDCYLFEARKGQVLAIDLYGDRLGANHDLLFVLRDASGKVINEQDDNPDIVSNLFYSRTDDPAPYRFTVPSDGVYQLIVASRDSYTYFGPRFNYNLRVAPEEPDFRLVVLPSGNQPEGALIHQGGYQAFTLLALRSGGFTGDIAISGDKLPPGVTLTPQIISGQQKTAAFVLGAAPEAPPGLHGLRLQGTALIQGKKVSREVRAGGLTWGIVNPQANTPYVSRLDRELILAVGDKAPYRVTAEKNKISVPQGQKVTIPLQVNRQGDFKLPVTVVGLSLPPGLVAQPATIAADKNSGAITLDSKTPPPPGNYTVVLRGQTLDPKAKPPNKPGAGPVNLVETAQPIELTIVPKDLAKLTATPTNAKISAGKTGEITVKVARKFDYSGPFKLEVEMPKGTKGITAGPAQIAASADEGKLVLQVAPGTPPGGNVSLTIRAIAMFNDIPIVHEAKVTVAVAK